jgi:CRP-like cAMP-binding protein
MGGVRIVPSPIEITAKNGLLATLLLEDREQLVSYLHSVSLSLKQVIYEVGDPLEHVYFIEQGVASVLTKMANGSTVEVGMIGMEGMVGMPALLGGETSAQHIVIQIPGTALRMDAVLCKVAFDRSAGIRRVVHRFAEAILNLSAQTAGCNRLHSLEQRSARWLLMARDRSGSDAMPMTHDFLASMLGVHRTGVTDAAGELQRSGLIRYSRGQVAIIDREGLEATACECYGIDHAQFERRASSG